jgi:hypothetical protein
MQTHPGVTKCLTQGAVMLHEFVASQRNEIIARYHQSEESRPPRLVNTVEMDDDVPRFLAQLVHELRPGSSSVCEMTKLSTAHAHDLLCQGFSIAQVVHHSVTSVEPSSTWPSNRAAPSASMT